jgi:exodeoxyribonuclease V gamma subunit
MLKLYSEKSYTTLYEKLSDLLSIQSSDIFATTWIVVPNHSAKDYLQKAIAKDLGICAQVRFILPLSFNWDVLSNVSVNKSEFNLFSKDVFRWYIFNWLENDKAYSFLSKGSQIENFNLAQNIAQVLLKYNDDYPEIVAKWDNDDYADIEQEDRWQIDIWKRLLEVTSGDSPAMLLNMFDSARDFNIKPANIIFFGVEQMTNLQRSTLLKLGQSQDVHIMLSNPCPEAYWFDMVGKKQAARALLLSSDISDFIDVGNPLLSSLGRTKMALFDSFISEGVELLGGMDGDDISGSGLVESVRRDIYELEELPVLVDTDSSVSINCCHNRTREVEVVKDIILDALSVNPALEPEDVVVVAPDINDYAQIIKDVFDNKSADSCGLPFYIDRVRLSDESYINSLMQILYSFNGEMTATSIYDVLTHDLILEMFSLSKGDLPRIKKWIVESNVRSFYSSQHKQSRGFDGRVGNTWSFGKNRWMSGYVGGGVEDSQYQSVFGDVSGQEQLFGGCFDFLKLWFDAYMFCKESHTPNQWHAFIVSVCKSFIANDTLKDLENKIALQLEFKLCDQAMDNEVLVPLPVILSIVENLISENNYRSEGQIGIRFQSWENAFTSGSKVLVLMGVNDGEFPMNEPKNDLNIFKNRNTRLNKSTRARDKNLMLGAITEDVDKLVVTYIGYDEQTNKLKLPSVVLGELVEYLKDKTSGGFDITYHKMHGFNRDYFNAAQLDGCSFSSSKLKLADEFYKPVADILDEVICLEAKDIGFIELNNLSSFFSEPMTYFLKTTAGINNNVYDDILEDYEAYSANGLEKFKLKNILFKHGMDGAIKSGILSDSKLGNRPLGVLNSELSTLVSLRDEMNLSLRVIDINLDGININGAITINDASALVGFSPRKINTKVICEYWIKYLCHQSSEKGYLYFEDKTVVFNPVDNTDVLLDILSMWKESIRSPWIFNPSKYLKVSKGKLDVQTRSNYLKSFVPSQYNFPSAGAQYFALKVVDFEPDYYIEKYINPIIRSVEIL